MKNTELQKLCESVGRRLTMRPVQVRFRQPAWQGAKGSACKRGRTAVVDIRPGLSSTEFLSVFLHEIGHVKTLWGSWTVRVPDYKPGSLRLPASFRTSGAVKVSEDAASQLACEWLNYANEHAAEHQGTWLVSRLKALEHYLEPELLAIQERAVNQAVERVLVRVQKNLKGR
jgi:hypothetical protein